MARQFIQHYFEPRLSVRPNKFCFYSQWTGPKKPRTTEIKRVVSNDILTYTARQRLISAVNLLVGTAKKKKLYSDDLKSYFSFRVNFVTLTLPAKQEHTDREIHNKVFKKFIEYWKTKNPALLYVYKAEVQDNGSLHYHLTTNSFIHYRKLRNMWNKALNLLGYVDRCKVPDPNSTDVHAVKGVKDLCAYLCTYVGKKDTYSKVLSRYLRRYEKRLKSLKSDVFHLPKNYFQHKECREVFKKVGAYSHKQYEFRYFKRRVQVKIWDASKSLLVKPLNLAYHDAGINMAVQQAEKLFKKVEQHEYVSIAFLDTLKLPTGNAIFEAYKEHIKDLLAVSNKAVHLLN